MVPTRRDLRPAKAWLAQELGADAITLGNHAYRHREVYEYLDREERIVRPANQRTPA